MTSTAVLDLAKRLQKLESEAKMLRNDVSNLEATKRNLSISESTTNRANEIRRNAAEGDVDASANSSSKRRRAHRTPARAAKLLLPQDFIDDLAHKAGEVQSTVDRHRALLREKADLTAILERVESEANAAEQKYYAIAELAGVDEDEQPTSDSGPIYRNRCNAVRRELLALYRKRELAARVMQAQSEELSRLAAMIEDTANAEQQKEDAIAVLAEKRANLAELRKNRAHMERNLRTKEGILMKKPTGPSKEDIIRSANYDRRVALHALEKEGEQLKMNDAAVRTRAMQIAKAEKRIEMIGDAVAGDGLNEEDRVDVELMEELISETAALYNLHQEATLRMDNLDAKLEKIDYKISAISAAISGTSRERVRIEEEHERYMTVLRRDFTRENTLNMQDIHRLERKLAKLLPASQTRSGTPASIRTRSSPSQNGTKA